MKILALDTSQLQASACIIDTAAGNRVVAGRTGSMAVAHSEALLPLIDDALKTAGLELQALDALAVGVGPGSFTGIRIGCATVKALAQVLKKPVVPFSSLEAIVRSAGGDVAMVNAYQGQVFVGWESATGWQESAEAADHWCVAHLHDELARRAQKIKLCGNGAHVYSKNIAAALERDGIEAENVELVQQPQFVTPEGIAALVGEKIMKQGISAASVNFLNLHANYLRPSQAELKLDERSAK